VTPDRLDLLRDVVRGPWPADLPPELLPRKRRRDYKGRRRPIMVRLPEPLAEALTDLASRAGLSVSEVAGLIVYSYLNRSGRV
jgi:hypothetical protein